MYINYSRLKFNLELKNKDNEMRERLEYIDKLKGLAIILVVMGHVATKSMNITTGFFNSFYSSINMPLFMFLSGIFAYKNFTNWDKYEIILFLKKKSTSILLPFITVGGGYSLLYCNNLANVYVGVSSGYWFLPALFYCMLYGLIVYWVTNAIRKSDKTYWVLSMHLFFWILVMIAYQLKFLVSIPYSLHAIKMYPFFCMGTFFYKYVEFKNKVIHSNNLYTISIIGYVILLIYGSEIPIKLNYAGVFSVIILVHLFANINSCIPQILSLIGKYSLEIYIFHWFMLPTLGTLGHWLSIQSIGMDQNFVILFCLTLIIAIPIIVVCIILSNIIRRSKLLNALFFGNGLVK